MIALKLTNIYFYTLMIVYRLKNKLIFIKVIATLFLAALFLNKFSKECYENVGIDQREVKLL